MLEGRLEEERFVLGVGGVAPCQEGCLVEGKEEEFEVRRGHLFGAFVGRKELSGINGRGEVAAETHTIAPFRGVSAVDVVSRLGEQFSHRTAAFHRVCANLRRGYALFFKRFSFRALRGVVRHITRHGMVRQP